MQSEGALSLRRSFNKCQSFEHTKLVFNFVELVFNFVCA
jgi:hypothetical protein